MPVITETTIQPAIPQPVEVALHQSRERRRTARAPIPLLTIGSTYLPPRVPQPSGATRQLGRPCSAPNTRCR